MPTCASNHQLAGATGGVDSIKSLQLPQWHDNVFAAALCTWLKNFESTDIFISLGMYISVFPPSILNMTLQGSFQD